MAWSVFHNVRLSALSAVVPPDSVSIEDELQYYDGSLEKIQRLAEVSGLRVRRKAADGVTASDLCFQAARALFEESRVALETVDAVLFVSHSPDYPLPATASLLQYRLGLSQHCAALDMNVGCAGFVHGLWVASGLVASGACRKVLLLVGDTPGRFADADNRVVAPVFGDAGTAALLESDESALPMSFLLENEGSKYETIIVPGGGSRIPHKAGESPEASFKRAVRDRQKMPWSLGGYCNIWMDGMTVYSFGVSVVPNHINEHLRRIGLDSGALDILFLHQANKIMVEAIGRKLGLPRDKTPYDTLPVYGNLGSSSIPALMCERFGKETTSLPDTVMLCGFGAGLAVSSCVLSARGATFLPVRDFVPEGEKGSREERIAYWHAKFKGE